MEKVIKLPKVESSVKLLHNGACYNGRASFRSVFGPKAELTAENVQKALDARLNIAWYLDNVLGVNYWEKPNYNEEVLDSSNRANYTALTTFCANILFDLIAQRDAKK